MRSAGLGSSFANDRAPDAEDRSRRTVIGSPSSEWQLVLVVSLTDVLCLIPQMFPNVERFRLVSTGRIDGV